MYLRGYFGWPKNPMRRVRVSAGYDRSARFCAVRIRPRIWLTVFGTFLWIASVTDGMTEPNTKNVLVVFSTYEGDKRSLELMESSVRAHFPGPVNFSTAYLDYQRLEEKSYRESLADTLGRGYTEVMPDALIVCSFQALQFIVQYRNKIFPGVPVVFQGLSASEVEGLTMLSGVTGVTGSVGLRETIDLALRLDPDTDAVAVVADTPGRTERFWLAATHSELLRHQDKLREIDVIGPPSAQMLEQVAALPPHAVVLFELAPQSSTQPAIGALDVLTAAAQHLPTYSPWATLCLNYGCIGGAYRDWKKESLLAGEIAARVLKGERPENIPVKDYSTFQIQVDWRVLQRWHIPESALPPGSVVLYRQSTPWEKYGKFLIPTILLIVIQALLIIGLLSQRARKRKAEAVLRESENRFQVMADTTPSLIWMCDPQGRITYLNERRIAFTGPDPDAGYGDTWAAYIHPDDVKNVLDTVAQALKVRQPFSKEYRLRRSDGVYRWMFDLASPRVNGDGSFAGFIGSAIDVTDQRLAQEALEKVGGQLIAAQEKERSHIARELHDDICQRLAMLSLRIERATKGRGADHAGVEDEFVLIWQQCSDLTGDVQALSHALHPSLLDNLGLVTAVRSFCRELTEQGGAEVKFTERDIPDGLSREVSLSLFRVVQEALHNAAKYSGGKQFEVILRGTSNGVELEVSDDGVGFDMAGVKNTEGLGLVSMRERIHLLNGIISIDSEVGAGTRIRARVPVPASSLASSINTD
jgi:PAS domain S-box-containing protein